MGNAADAGGEMYFGCRAFPGPYITQYQVRVDPNWNVYSECNGGNCIFHEPNIDLTAGYGLQLGVGRESSLGGGIFVDGQNQCDDANPYIGYWYLNLFIV